MPAMKLRLYSILTSIVVIFQANAGELTKAELAEIFETKVRPILAKRCYECHSNETGPDNDELVLENVEGLKAGGSRGPLFDSENLEQSLFLKALSFQDPDLLMPPEGKLPAEELAVLQEWVRLGAVTPEYKNAPKNTSSSKDVEAGRDFWSFRPLQKAAVPVVDGPDADWPKRPMDHFILARLQAEKLRPSSQADRRTLLRRISYDLVGLPPTFEQVQAFVNDTSPDAYERMVDVLLASPQYGERWGRFWLDLARYADVIESWLETGASAWLYRDWVVDAFNRNLPYDQFVKLQLAGDMLDLADPTDVAATGFLGLSPSYWKELKLAPDMIEKVVAEEWDERVDAFSRTFLGLTVACARCHDHKFDPITMEDYYGLAGVFASTQQSDVPLLPKAAAKVVMEARAKIDPLEKKLTKIKDKKSSQAQELQQQIEQIKAQTPHFDAPLANSVREAALYVVADGEHATKLKYEENQPRDLPVFRRGNPSNPGPIVPRRFLAVLSDATPFTKGSGRLELAEALFNEAAPLTARVIVNRIWAQHFGIGLVRTPSDFGTQGEQPTHPELLDYLAGEFIARGWDLKWLHREILLSAAYRQTSFSHELGESIDPENRLLWRANRRRLEIEMWRDGILAVVGSLNTAIGGPSVPVENSDNYRRTIYATIARRDLNPMLRLFDFPEPTSHSPRRLPTTTPLQQLFVLNGPFIAQQAKTLVTRLPEDSPSAGIVACYRAIFQRDPVAEEIEIGTQFLESAEGTMTRRWQDYVHGLLALNEFVFVD